MIFIVLVKWKTSGELIFGTLIGYRRGTVLVQRSCTALEGPDCHSFIPVSCLWSYFSLSVVIISFTLHTVCERTFFNGAEIRTV